MVPHQAEHQQAEVVVVALLPEKRTKTVNESEDLEAEAMKRERRKGLVAGKEKEIGKEIEKDVQEVAIVQLLLVHDQRVEVDVLNKKSLSRGIVLFKSKLKVCYESRLMVPRAVALGGIHSSPVILSNWFESNLLIVYNPF